MGRGPIPSHFYEINGHARILANRNVLVLGNGYIFKNRLQLVPGNFSLFYQQSFLQFLFNASGKANGSSLQEFDDNFGKLGFFDQSKSSSRKLPYNPELLAKVTYSVIPAKAGIQNCSKILDSGSRFACPE
jgi:hypothetical protein